MTKRVRRGSRTPELQQLCTASVHMPSPYTFLAFSASFGHAPKANALCHRFAEVRCAAVLLSKAHDVDGWVQTLQGPRYPSERIPLIGRRFGRVIASMRCAILFTRHP